MRYRISKLAEELTLAGLPFSSINSAHGVTEYPAGTTEIQMAAARVVMLNHDPNTASPSEQRIANMRRVIANRSQQVDDYITLFAGGGGTALDVRNSVLLTLRVIRYLFDFLRLDTEHPDFVMPPEPNLPEIANGQTLPPSGRR